MQKQNHHRGLSLTWEWLYASSRDTKVICNTGKAHPWVLLTKVSIQTCLCWQGVSCQGAHRNTEFHFSTPCHTSHVPLNADFTCVSTGQPGMRLTSDPCSQGSLSLCKANSVKRLVGTKSPNYPLLPDLVWVRRSCLEEGMTENFTKEKLAVRVFGDPSGVQGNLGCESKRTNIQETLSTRKTKTAPRKLRQECQT